MCGFSYARMSVIYFYDYNSKVDFLFLLNKYNSSKEH